MPPVSLGLGEADHAAADQWLQDVGIASPFIALGPGSPWGAKRWPGYPALAAALDAPVVAIGGPTDQHLGEQIVAAAPGRAFSACGQVGPRVSAALIARAEVLVTNDSSPLHLGLAVGTRMVALFGPTVPSFGFGPTDPRDICLGLDDLLCRPCATFGPAVCPLDHHRCLRDLALDRVLAAVAVVRGAPGDR
jgi:heptosyltransferase-2